MSRISSSGRTSWMLRTSACAVAANSVATTTSVGSGISAPRSRARAISRRQVSSMSISHSDLPTPTPVAARKVLAMPPPTISRSTFSSSASRMVSLVLTFEPATMATSGRAGFSSARSSAASSPTSSGPAQATGAKRATPCVEASARCAVPKASMTKTSHSAAMRARQLFVVLLLALVEAHVLAEHDLAGLDRHAVEPVLHQRHAAGPAASDSRVATGASDSSGSYLPSSGRPEMRHQDDPRALVERHADGGQRRADARVAGDLAVLDRHVQILADQHALAGRSVVI